MHSLWVINFSKSWLGIVIYRPWCALFTLLPVWWWDELWPAASCNLHSSQLGCVLLSQPSTNHRPVFTHTHTLIPCWEKHQHTIYAFTTQPTDTNYISYQVADSFKWGWISWQVILSRYLHKWPHITVMPCIFTFNLWIWPGDYTVWAETVLTNAFSPIVPSLLIALYYWNPWLLPLPE